MSSCRVVALKHFLIVRTGEAAAGNAAGVSQLRRRLCVLKGRRLIERRNGVVLAGGGEGGGGGLSLYLPVAFRRLPRVRPRRASTAAVRRFLGPIEVKAVGRVDGRRGWGRAALLPLFFPSCLRSVWNRWTQRRGSRSTGEPVAAPLGRLRFIDRSISLGSTRPNSTTLDALLIHGPQSVRGAGKVPPDSVRCHLQRRRWRRPRMRRHRPSCPLHPFHPTRNQ